MFQKNTNASHIAKLNDSFPVTTASTRLSISASEVESIILAVASRTSFITIRMPQLRSSRHSRHRMYAVRLTQGSGAIGPSSMRIMCPTLIRRGSRLRKYPPPLPFLLCRIPWFLSSSRINSRNLRGIPSRCATSEISTGPWPYSLAKTIRALRAYLDFFESITGKLLDRVHRLEIATDPVKGLYGEKIQVSLARFCLE